MSLLQTLGSIVPVAISVLSLAVATTALAIATRKPQIALAMPRRIRLEYNPWQTVFYVQPSLFVSNLTTRAAVIVDMELEVRLVDEAAGVTSGDRTAGDVRRTIPWWGVVAFEWSDELATEVFGEIKSDAVPLPVTLATPQAPMASFLAPPDWQEWLQAGRRYDLRLYATLGSSRKRLEGTIKSVYLEEDKIHRLNARVAEVVRRANEANEEPTEEGEYQPFFPREYVSRLSVRPKSMAQHRGVRPSE